MSQKVQATRNVVCPFQILAKVSTENLTNLSERSGKPGHVGELRRLKKNRVFHLNKFLESDVEFEEPQLKSSLRLGI